MNGRFAFPFLFLSLLFLGCHQEDAKNISEPSFIEVEPGQQVSLSFLAIGQKSRLVAFLGKGYFNPEKTNDFTYQQDTLVLEVVGFDGTEYTLAEYLTPGSISLDNPDNSLVIAPADTAFFQVQRSGDTALVSGNGTASRLLPYWLLPSIPLKEINRNPVVYTGWFFTIDPYAETWDGHDPDLYILGRSFGHANILVRNREMAVDGPGYTVAITADGLILRSVSVNPWTGEGLGWDLLEK